MKKKLLGSIVLGLFFLSFAVTPPPYGIDSPSPIEPFLNDVFPKQSPIHGNWKAVNAFPNLTFTDPIAMQEIPNQFLYYVAGKHGVIWLVPDTETAPDKSVALDIRDRVITSEDAGLINFILHPEFSVEGSENWGVLFVFYAYHPTSDHSNNERMNRLSKFRTYENTFDIDPDSEEILIQDYDPQGWHMGGGMFFDEEGFLYLSFGDGGGANDGYDSSQQIDQRFWGGLIRIDVDNDASRSHPIRRQPIEYPDKPADFPPTFTQGYMIPDDNPWVSEDGNTLEEFYGLGLRSPHRASYDPVDQKIWIADVGQGKKEEISVMPKGGNCQWPFKEGSDSGPRSRPLNVIGEEVSPSYEYSRSEGVAIIGGFVYRGEKWFPYLENLYIFADYSTQNIWSFNPITSEVILLATVPEFGVGAKDGLSSFATNAAGDIFVLKLYGTNLDGGVIYKIELDDEPTDEIPTLLSQTGAFTDLAALTPAPGIIPYAVNSPLWSDGALKKRWVALANDGTHDSPEEQINLFKNADWQFPNGTVFIKHFELPVDERDPSITQKVETRFFIIDEEGRGYGLTYKWNDQGTDAELLETFDQKAFDIIDEFGQVREQIWEYPSRTQCMNCHTANAGFVLGVNTWQLNGDYDYPSGITSNQLATWNHLGMFAEAIEETDLEEYPKAKPLSDDYSLQEQVSAYLASNCAHCHRPGGVEGTFDARFDTPMAYKNIINALGISHNSPRGSMIVSAGEPENSQLWIRDNSIEENKMPPLAKSIVDEQYIRVLTEWIEGLEYDCNGNFASDFEFSNEPDNGYGPVEKDQSNGEPDRDDGQTITIAGKEFDKGLGVHAYSKITYDLDGKYVQFTAFIGVDDEACEQGSVQFTVVGDGDTKYQSPIMRSGEDARFISVDISEVRELALIVTSPTDAISCDHANWAAAKILRRPDSDGDGVCDDYDLCPGADDRIDDNNDGIPDNCEIIQEGGTIEMAAFPNPFLEYVEIQLERPAPLLQKAQLSVYDLNGRLLYQDSNVAYEQKYRLGQDWHAGIYVIHVKAGEYDNRIKVVKQK